MRVPPEDVIFDGSEDALAQLRREGYLPSEEQGPHVRSDEQKKADEAASIRLLSGYDVDKSDNFTFPDHFSDEEKELRAALARTVRDQMKGHSGELLALAIDPFTPSKLPNMRPTRKVKFFWQGQQSTLFLEQQIIAFIRKKRSRETKRDVPIDSYVKDAEEEFGLRRSRIFEIWKAYENLMAAKASGK